MVQKVSGGRVTSRIHFFLSSHTYKFLLSKYTESKMTLWVELPIFIHLPQFAQVSSRRQLLSFQIDAFNSICQQRLQSSILMDPNNFHRNMLDTTKGARGAGPGGVADRLPSRREGLAAEETEGAAAASRLTDEALKTMSVRLCVPD